MGLIIPILIIVFCCIVIWKASDGFETSSEYLGRNMSEGVRGATINAIASSMPELFTTIFFLWFLKDTDGFSGGIGTTAGSAIFNGMIIPAVVIFAATCSISHGAKNCPFLTLITHPVLAASTRRSVCRHKKAGI